MINQILDSVFNFVCEISPKVELDGEIKEFYPEQRYEKKEKSHLHKYGKGPFCKFTIPNRYKGESGVYFLLMDNFLVYIGECEDIVRRFNNEYGSISPKSCYKGGQQTNCRINKEILKSIKNKSKMILLFYKTNNYKQIERVLISELKPIWNLRIERESQKIHEQNVLYKNSYPEVSKPKISKYQKLGKYLENSKKKKEILDFIEIEKILGFPLPPSAYKYREWWANHWSHSQAISWLNAGWKVGFVSQGEKVIFKRVSIIVEGS